MHLKHLREIIIKKLVYVRN